jgi:dihydrofolate reductase
VAQCQCAVKDGCGPDRELKRERGKNIAMYGSLSVVRALSHLRLIDEYELLVHPTLWGRESPYSTLPSTLWSSSRHIPFGRALC